MLQGTKASLLVTTGRTFHMGLNSQILFVSFFFFSHFIFAEKPVEDPSSRASETSQIQFRGYQNVTDEPPFMGENWKVSFFQLASVEAGRLDDQSAASLFMYNFLSFNYKIDNDSRIAIRPVFTISSPGTDKYDEDLNRWKTALGDAYISYSRFNLSDIGPFGTRANLRLYVPSSEFSRNNGMITQIHPEYYLETSLGRHWGVELQFKGDYFFNSKRAYSFKTESGTVIQTTNKEVELESIAELRYRINRFFAFKPRILWHDEWYLSSPSNNKASRHNQEFSYGAGFEFRGSENFNTTLQFSNVLQTYPRRRRESLGLPQNNEIVALTNYRF
jgi:hypothetical protein